MIGPGRLGALNEALELNSGTATGGLVHTVIVQGTFVGSIIFETSVDGTTWFGLKMQQGSTTGTVASDLITAPGVYAMSTFTPVTRVRARMSAYTSGTALVSIISAD